MAKIDYTMRNEIYDTVNEFLEVRLPCLAFNNCEQGTIHEVNSNGTYKVRINDDIYLDMKTINNNTYVKNDVVWIVKINGNSSYKYVLCKV